MEMDAATQLRKLVFYGADIYEDKPHQFWNHMRMAADLVGNTDAAEIFNDYYIRGCPFNRERKQLAGKSILYDGVLPVPLEAMRVRAVAKFVQPGDIFVTVGTWNDDTNIETWKTADAQFYVIQYGINGYAATTRP
jgi:hypothetical protein